MPRVAIRDCVAMSMISERAWIQSVPPRGSGWVPSRIDRVSRPTRYREVVLTVSKHAYSTLERSCPKKRTIEVSLYICS